MIALEKCDIKIIFLKLIDYMWISRKYLSFLGSKIVSFPQFSMWITWG